MNVFDRLKHPFWYALVATGCLAALAMAGCLLAYLQTGQTQVLALAGLAGLDLAALGVCGWLARRGRYTEATWLAAAVQILVVVAAAGFAADFWIVGLMALAVVPMQVGVADKIGRMPMAIVCSLMGAAAMLLIDLGEAGSRIPLASALPLARPVATLLLGVYLAVLIYFFWRFRLNLGSPYSTRLDLATQLTLVLTLIAAASIVLVTGVLIGQIRTYQIDQVGESFQTLAKINAERVGNNLEAQIRTLLSLSRREEAILQGIIAANETYPHSPQEIQALLDERQLHWVTLAEYTDFILQYRNNAQTKVLSKFRGFDLLYNNVFITDRYGGLVAAQGEKPARFAFGDETWWKRTWNAGQGGAFIGNLAIHPQTKAASVFIAVSVLDPQTNLNIGVLASTFELSAIQRDFGNPKTQAAAAVHLFSQDGMIIAGPSREEIGQPAWPALLSTGILSNTLAGGAPPLPGVILALNRENRNAVFAHAPLDSTTGFVIDALHDLGWRVVVSDIQANALAGVTRSTKVASLAGVVSIVLVVIAAIATARVITRPIDDLTTVAASIAAGRLSQRAEPVGPVEMVTLAEAFNTLTAQLRSLINNLQDQVAQRTAQLEARAEQLATLNRITQAVASVSELNAALEIVAREMVLLFKVRNSSIALLAHDRSALVIVADHSQSGPFPSTIGINIPVTGNLSSERVLATGHSIVIPDPQTNPLTESIHNLMRERRTECLMIVPLLARGEVIGTIGLASNEPGRVFSQGEVALAETIAGQIAGAIENARLFSENQKAREAAETANQAKSDFLANISHELRTPLTSVLGFARIIQKRLHERIFPAIQAGPQAQEPRLRRAIEQVDENISIIISEGDRLTTLINDVLDLAKIEAGKIEWQIHPLSIAEVIERAVTATSTLFEGKGLQLILKIPGDLPEVNGDRNRLIQVMINLLSNAVKFTHQGSVTCRVTASHKEIEVRVIDTGIGIAPSDQPRVFEKFTQVGDTLTDKPRGTGLGLPICKEIIEVHGGRIWVESSVGTGSTFAFTLPFPERGDSVIEGAQEKERSKPMYYSDYSL